MLPFLRKKPVISVGIEIHADEIKLLKLRHAAASYTIENYAVEPLPEDAIVDDKIKRVDRVQAALQKLVQKTRASGCPAAIALPANNVITKRIKLPICLSLLECEMEISANLSRYFPGMTAELYFDFFMLPSAGGDYHDLMLVAARAEDVQAYVSLVTTAGLLVKIVDVDSQAAWRGAQLSLTPEFRVATAVIALCEVGRSMTRLMVVQQQQIMHLQQWQNADFPDGEAQIKRVLQRFLAIHRQLQIDCLLLAGASWSRQEGIDIPIRVENPFQNMRYQDSVSFAGLQQVAGRFQVCCGLATRSFSR